MVKSSRTLLTPLILALLAIEMTDIVFAFDSVPAVLAITREFFTAYSSSVMAILGLRSLYFVVEHGVRKMKGIGKGLSIYLVYLGAAFILSELGLDTLLGLRPPHRGHTRGSGGFTSPGQSPGDN